MEEGEVITLDEVYLVLESLNILVPDFILEVDATDGQWGYLKSHKYLWTR
jgi:hypothetical protein